MKSFIFLLAFLVVGSMFSQAQDPAFHFMWNQLKGGQVEISKDSLLALIDYPISLVNGDTALRVSSFDLTFECDKLELIMVRGDSNYVNRAMIEHIKKMQLGDVVYLDNVKMISKVNDQSQLVEGSMALIVVE